MILVKKFDWFIVRAYLQLFVGSFCVCLLIFMMQFLWKFADELLGKGLPYDVLGKFFFYSALNLVSTSLPLAVLLASLITFGNLGERLELLAMKASGVPLTRILRPVFVLSLMVCGVSFYFQNYIGPNAMKELSRLIWSVKQKAPETEIHEGIFNNQIPGINIYVERKDPVTGRLYNVMIYRMQTGYDDAEIVLADSGTLQSTANRMHMLLTLYHGQRFRNMDSPSGNSLRANIPYMRENFIQEEIVFEHDGNMNMLDVSLFSNDAQTKQLSDITHGIDSLTHHMDSVSHHIFQLTKANYMRHALPQDIKDSAAIVERAASVLPIDSFYNRLQADQQTQAWQNALQRAQIMRNEVDFYSMTATKDGNFQLRKHRMEWHKKFSLSVACLLFFFIGAPLGAIIRKGGLGLPVVISVAFFIFYYIIDIAGVKMAKTGKWDPLLGMWVSAMVLLPIGMFLTQKANKDSTVFNVEGYRAFFMRLLGLRAKRKLNRKEVVIQEVDYAALHEELDQLTDLCINYQSHHRLHLPPSYRRLFFRYNEDQEVLRLSTRLEAMIETAHNIRDAVVIQYLNTYPIIAPHAHTRPFNNRRLNMLVGIFLPFGLLMWVRIYRYRLRLWRDFQTITRTNYGMQERIEKQYIKAPNPTLPEERGL